MYHKASHSLDAAVGVFSSQDRVERGGGGASSGALKLNYVHLTVGPKTL
eukprot:CAMPEP_0198307346 /NCGR_PEP_ID=MMETSP1450-20131203/241_1 /TAXON_ID=753684 ORGANISM="Madagascaria erythrocladiodes, Strain CCMP3234" /NCGR_SAMPLE_ID=MMETSP1450 /ASSEMBLY_ACC=CAM_ASM_001115 /LENGTH=48 /DNA_ID= /DNA_START= /DNA_END= /DNA_ORIENTATION=